ncbi:MAG: DNA repair protein RecN, partial [Gammaproteobacteria bacterium]|nr:DNA repair protein RecN [Gammaproteobacteria bacterium]
MLKTLEIRNYAIVDQLTLDFDGGMSVLSGETGAGKSILLDALGLTLGDRADSQVVAPNAKRAEISASYQIDSQTAIRSWLDEHELDSDDECIVRRTVGSDGRSRAFINGQPVPLQSVRELGEMLVEIHGQHAHQSLLKKDEQRQLLDQFAHHMPLVAELSNHYKTWQQSLKQLNEIVARQSERQAYEELLNFQIAELTELGLTEEELSELDIEHRRLSHAHQLMQESHQALQQIENDEHGSTISTLSTTGSSLQELQKIDDALTSVAELVDSATIQLREAAGELRDYLDRLEVDPQRLEQIDQRLSEIHQIARKHHIKPEELPALLEKLTQEQEKQGNTQETMAALQQQVEKEQKLYQQIAERVTESRREAAIKLAQAVTTNIQQLGMGEGVFEVKLTALAEGGAHGMEQVEFMIQTNAGQLMQSLNKIASGGELSRISLAIQVVNADQHQRPTMIFDEVDVGVGGSTAEMVGKQLQKVAAHCQVICVTHQPQVAAHAHNHFRISKLSD